MFYFSKMQGTGNDFIIIDYIKNKFEYSFKRLAEFLCNRHYGVGADGILVIDKSEIADFKMRIFNKDGSEAEMCGNGIRCFGKYVYEHSLTNKKIIMVETVVGIKKLILKVEGETVASVKVDMGNPIFEYDKIPVIYNENIENNVLRNQDEDLLEKLIDKKIVIDNRIFYAVSMGNPHVVCFEENVDNLNLEILGKKIENYKFFPNKTNVEFVQIIEKNKIKVRIWERGVGETLSCGTGVCAASVVSYLVKNTAEKVNVNIKGGMLKVEYNEKENKVYLEGDAEEVFEGNLNI